MRSVYRFFTCKKGLFMRRVDGELFTKWCRLLARFFRNFTRAFMQRMLLFIFGLETEINLDLLLFKASLSTTSLLDRQNRIVFCIFSMIQYCCSQFKIKGKISQWKGVWKWESERESWKASVVCNFDKMYRVPVSISHNCHGSRK